MDYKWCAVDAEGDVGAQGLLGVALYSDAGSSYLRGRDDIRTGLLGEAHRGATFAAHNASYDLSVIWWQLGLPARAHGNNGRFTHGTWKYDRKRPEAQIWDTYELSGKLSLQGLGEAIQLPKLPTPQRLLGIDPDRYHWHCEKHGVGECVECYSLRDAEIVYRFMTGWEGTLHGWGVEPKRRLSASALACWQALDRPTPNPIRHPKVRTLGRDAYHGGRVESYKLGTVCPLWTADVSSMYASVMRTVPMPDPDKLIYVTNIAPEHVKWELEGVADVEVTVPAMHVPPLPFKRGKRLLYPVGRFRTACTMLELRYALSLGCTIDKVHRVCFSLGVVHPFNETIDVLWALREAYIKQGDPRALHAKLLLNNLYGMLGVRETRSKRTSQLWDGKGSMAAAGWDNATILDNQTLVVKERSQTFLNPWSNVLWAAQVAGAARVKLHRLQVLQGANLAYSDTDCIYSTAPIVGLGEGLGGLKDTGQYEEALLAGPKMYALKRADGGWHARCKGTKREVALSFLKQGYAAWREPVGPLQAARKGVPAGTWIEVYREQHVVEPRRTILNPSVVTTGVGYSETAPPVEGAVKWPEGGYGGITINGTTSHRAE